MTQSPSPSPRRSRRGFGLAALLALPLIGALVLYFAVFARNGEAVANECLAAKPVVERVVPLARGEVAAVSVHRTPKPAPAAAFNAPDGTALTLDSFKGKTILVNLWATWCAPCREEMPALDQLQAEFGGPDFEVVAVNIDTRNLDKPAAWLAENKITNLARYAEPQGTLLQTLQRSGHVVGLPTTVLISPQGCELALLKGPAAWASPDAKALIRAALGR